MRNKRYTGGRLPRGGRLHSTLW